MPPMWQAAHCAAVCLPVGGNLVGLGFKVECFQAEDVWQCVQSCGKGAAMWLGVVVFGLLVGCFLLLLIGGEGEVGGFDAGELLLGASESESKERAITFHGFDLFELFGGALPSGFVEGVLLDVDFLEKVFGGGAGFEKVEANPERLAPRGLEEIKATAGGREKE